MPFYSLYYYRKATALRPHDSRMWTALANCYETLGKNAEAIQCYLRADTNQDREGIALLKLAKLYEKDKKDETALTYYKRNLLRRDTYRLGGDETVETLKALALLCKRLGRLDEAEKLALRLFDHSHGKDDAKMLLKEIHSLAMLQPNPPSAEKK